MVLTVFDPRWNPIPVTEFLSIVSIVDQYSLKIHEDSREIDKGYEHNNNCS